MLAPDSRVVLLDQLRPPVGYTLDAAVTTTFTLDLSAALIPPLAFAAYGMSSTPDPVAALEAVRSCADRMDVFAQAGELIVPTQPSDLMAFLEPMIHEVHVPGRRSRLFHPKIWLLRYRSPDDEPSYRLLCLTRNLTNDHSWDLALRLDGTDTGKREPANRPLVRLVRALPDLVATPLPPDRRNRVEQLAADVYRVQWELPMDAWDLRFHALGIRGVSPDVDFAGYRHLVVSPFLTDGGLEIVAPGQSDLRVVSRPEELDRLAPDTAAALSSFVVSGVAGITDDAAPHGLGTGQILSGLHAKLYVAERARVSHVFLGSANATDAAFRGNVEFLVELIASQARMGVEAFVGQDAPFRAMLEDYKALGGQPPDPEDEAKRELAELLRSIAAVPYMVTASARAAAGYTLHVTREEPLSVSYGYHLTLELLTRPGEAQNMSAAPLNARFGPLPLADVTPFLVARASAPGGLQGGTVIRGELQNDPAGRLDEVLARQVNTPEKFLRFLVLLLGFGNPNLLSMLTAGEGGSAAYVATGPGPGVFEMIVRALADHPNALRDLDSLVQRLRVTEDGRKVLPPGFDTLWAVVLETLGKLEVVTEP